MGMKVENLSLNSLAIVSGFSLEIKIRLSKEQLFTGSSKSCLQTMFALNLSEDAAKNPFICSVIHSIVLGLIK